MDTNYWMAFYGEEIALEPKTNGTFQIPQGENPFTTEVKWLQVNHNSEQGHVAKFEKKIELKENWQWVGLRESFKVLPFALYELAAKAIQILHWDKNSRFCPACGTPTQLVNPICKKCPNCGNELYPPIHPAVIVRIHKDDKILMVRAHNFNYKFRGLVAGFVEPGESIEEAVYREVKEETNLSIKNLRYFSSQSWPHPSGLMLGFTADYESGEIKLQKEELAAADFFDREHLPLLPDKTSISRKLIDDWINN